MSKRQIMINGESGVAIAPRDVIRVRRGRRTIVMRHAWPDDIDARVWDSVKRAAMSGAVAVANATRRAVELRSSEGWVMEIVEPDGVS